MAGRAGPAPALGLALVAALLGATSKRYAGPGATLVVGYAWDVLGSAAVYALARAAWPRPAVWTLFAGVLLALFSNELLQLVQHPWLAALRATAVGSVALGVGFDPYDFVAIASGTAGAATLDARWRRPTKGPWRGPRRPGSTGR